jgi:hypothetical protein
MLSIVEAHNMGLTRGFRPEPLYGRDTYGLEAAALEAASGNVALQQQLNDLISNSFLESPLQHHQCSVPSYTPSVDLTYSGLTSMGFCQSDNFLLEDLPPVVDHYFPVSSSTVPPSASTFASIGMSLPRQPSLPLQRPWLDEDLDISPRGLKRDRDVDQTGMQPRKKLDRISRTMETKSKRPGTEQAGDHILRERQRRDDMTSKFAVLESLLPIGVKRDRATIVDDSIEFVKNLHHRIKSLQARKVELHQASTQKTAACRRGPMEVLQPRCGSSPVKESTKGPVLSRRPRVSEEELKGIHDLLRSCLEKLEVHADLPHQVVIEMVCKLQPRLQSNVLLCMENLNLEVMQCSITKIAHRLIYVIIAKPQEENMNGIVAALKNALQC